MCSTKVLCGLLNGGNAECGGRGLRTFTALFRRTLVLLSFRHVMTLVLLGKWEPLRSLHIMREAITTCASSPGNLSILSKVARIGSTRGNGGSDVSYATNGKQSLAAFACSCAICYCCAVLCFACGPMHRRDAVDRARCVECCYKVC
jgi:hypothetical protein